MTRVGNHEVVRVRPFVRIAGNLSLTVTDLSAGIPPFNPQRLLAESAPGGGSRRPTTRRRPSPMPKWHSSCVTFRRCLPKLKIADAHAQ